MNKDKCPFVSVIVPMYNEEMHIGRCLESIKNQDYPKEKIEIIVVDDGSTDQSVNIARKYEVKILRQKNKGPGVARNNGVHEASGDIIAFVDADDMVDKSWLSELVVFLDDEKIAAVGCLERALAKNSDFLTIIWLERYLRLISSPEKTDHLGSSGCIYKKDIFLEVCGFDPKLIAAEDMDLSNKIRKEGYDLLLFKKPLLSVKYPDTLFTYFVNQMRKSAYVVLFYLRLRGTKEKSASSYSNMVDYIQSLFPFIFFASLFMLRGLSLIIILGALLLLLVLSNTSYIHFIFVNKDKERLSSFWPLVLAFYLMIRSLTWSAGLVFGIFLTARNSLYSSSIASRGRIHK